MATLIFERKINLSIPRHNKLFKKLVNKYELHLLACEALELILASTKELNEWDSSIKVYKFDRGVRLVFISEDKIFSMSLPFLVKNIDNEIIFTYKGIDVEFGFISSYRLFIKQVSEVSEYSIHDLYENIAYSGDFIEEYLDRISLFYSILHLELGYLRYDYDDSVNRVDEIYHPKNHFDIFIEDRNAFKIGVKDRVSEQVFLDFIDNKAPRSYLK